MSDTTVHVPDLLEQAKEEEGVQLVDVDELTLHPENPREGNVEAIKESIEENGFFSVLLVQESTGYVVIGNHRLKAARELGLERVPTLKAPMGDDTALRILLADNRTGDVATYDDDKLADVLQHLERGNDDGIEGTGFSGGDMNDLLDELGRIPGNGEVDDPGAEVDRAEELREKWGTKRGQLWQIGDHRLLCGDATDEGDVERLLDGAEPTVLWTDPPYGIDYEAMRSGAKIENDENLSTAKSVIASAFRHIASAEVRFSCCDWRSVQMIRSCFKEVGWDDKACIVWDKKHGVQNLDRFAKSHELMVYSGPYGGEETVDRDVWTFPREYEPDIATPKPVELVSHSLGHVEQGDVYDPFVGSGTTIIAADKRGRTCYALDIDPASVAVCLQRADDAGMDTELID